MAGGDSPSSADGAPPAPAPQLIEQRLVLVRTHGVKSESNGEPSVDKDGSSESNGEPSVDKDGSSGTLPNVVGPRLKKGPWTQSEDDILEAYVKRHGERNWKAVQKNTGLLRCGKSCRLRWMNHLRPSLKKGPFTKEEENLIIKLHYKMGNKWAQMAAYLPGRTDNEIKNYWNTRIKKCKNIHSLLYPADVCQQASNEDQHESTGFSSRENLPNDELLGNGIYVPNFTFDKLPYDLEDISCAPQFSDVSLSNILGQRFASKDNDSMDQTNHVEVLKESESPFPVLNENISDMFSSVELSRNQSEKFGQACGIDCHYVTNSSDKTMAPSTADFFDSCGFSNGHFSASRSTIGPSKMELPSFQDTEFDPNSWSMHSRTSAMQPTNSADACVQYTVLPAKSDCVAPRNSHQSEEALQKTHALNYMVNQQLPVGSLSSSSGTPYNVMMESSELDLRDEYWEQDPDVHALVGSSFCSSPLHPASPDELQNCELPSAETPVAGSNKLIAPQYEHGDVSPHNDDFWSDAALFLNDISLSISQDEIDMLMETDMDTEAKHVSSGTGTTTLPK
ncbi:hypothetical protein ABZP36_013761 [Zizania latifolia]